MPLDRPLDVLVQHLVTVALGGGFQEVELRQEVQSAYAYRQLTDQEWQWCMDFVTRGGQALKAYPQFRRVVPSDGTLMRYEEMSMFSGFQGNPQQAQDFVNRYQQGAPQDGYSNQEVAQQYQQVVPQLSPEQFMQAAQQSFQNMPPDQRQQFGQFLQQQAQQQGYAVPSMQQPTMYQDPNALAQMTSQVHQQNPGLLGSLLGAIAGQQTGGVPSGPTWQTLDPQTRDLFIRQWGNRAQEEWQKENARNMGGGQQAGGMSGMLGSPVAKAALAGIAAMAVKNMIGR